MAPSNNKSHEELFGFFNEIGIIAQLSTAMFEQKLPEGLTQSQFSVLNWFIRVDSQATPTRLAKAFQVTGGAMTNTLKKLEGKGLVKIVPDKTSGRQKLVTLTAEGRKTRDKAIASVAPLLQEFADEFDRDKLKKTTLELAAVRRYLDESRYRQ